MAGPRCWLSRGGDTRIKVDAHGVSLGRALGNDVVVRNPAASQLHALVHLGPGGPELLTFGRNGTRVNGTVVETATALRDGDVIDVPGEALTVHLEATGPQERVTMWGIAASDGTLYGLRRPIKVGGGVVDDIEVPGWPPGALSCTPVQGALVLQLAAPARIGGVAAEAGDLRLARVGDEIEIGGAAVRLYGEAPCGQQDTVLSPNASLPDSAVFSFLPTGAQLTLRFDHGEASMRLSEVRARLVATLLGAGTEGRPGE